MTTTFEHKYNLGDRVWFMYDNKTTYGEIVAIKFIAKFPHPSTNHDKTFSIEYEMLRNDFIYQSFKENARDVFPTKQALLDSL